MIKELEELVENIEVRSMKRKRIVIFAFIIITIVSSISIALNIRTASEQGRIRRNMINQVYGEMRNISLNLDGLIYNIENEVTDCEINQQNLTMLSQNFVRLDTILKLYVYYFPSERIYYGDVFDFGFISYTLTAGTGTANGMAYSGITMDNAISENKVRYLTILRDDINLIVAAMVSNENPPQENQNLTTSQINTILDTFFSKWSFHNENSPYMLLRNKP